MFTALAVFFIGLGAGFINVIVGSGSSIMVPALLFLGLPPHVAIATNRFAMLFNNFTGAAEYYRKRYLNLKTALVFAASASVGGAAGALFVLQTKPELLVQIIGIILLIEAGIIVFGNKALGVGSAKEFDYTGRSLVIAALVGLLIGVYGGFIGMAITSMYMFVFVYFFKFRFIESAALAKAVTFAISFFATIVFIAHLKVDFLLGIVLVASYIIGAYAGVHTAIRIGDVRIKALFVLVAVASAVKLLFF